MATAIKRILRDLDVLSFHQKGQGDNSFVKTLGLWPCRKRKNPITAITFSCAAIHFPLVYNLAKASSSHTVPIWCGRLKIP